MLNTSLSRILLILKLIIYKFRIHFTLINHKFNLNNHNNSISITIIITAERTSSIRNVKYEPVSYSAHPQAHHLQVSNSLYTHQSQVQSQQPQQFDFNHNYHNGRTNVVYPLSQMATPFGPTTSLPNQPIVSNPTTNMPHVMLGPRYSGGSTGSNVLMLPPNHHPRGGSLPDLRTDNSLHHQQISFSTTPSPPASGTQHFLRSSSPHQQNGDNDLFLFVRISRRF